MKPGQEPWDLSSNGFMTITGRWRTEPIDTLSTPPRERVGAARADENRIDSENVADPGDRAQVLGIADLGADDQG